MIDILSNYYLNKKEPQKSCLLALRSIILNMDKDVSETVKYEMPCFCYKKKMFCYLWTDKKTGEPYILMAEGKLLNHSELEQGSRSRMKILRIDPNEDLPIETIELILNDALNLYKNGIIKIKK
ncbi:DUF1801 domain-containing protein [uncultured Dysgonomonas sp.]|uniref:YdhG-like domain-containing protein n=1 Tax=uncultured Dysgonomonas sp. TaxID=206096 RepID=A0A212JR19_9BACT|nr:DUF1801 domain-containing protein [uncultured Dysgonomonas sp.]SBW01914.1 conserved hypothetical protein [uncultured Dysgonomonas sp.]